MTASQNSRSAFYLALAIVFAPAAAHAAADPQAPAPEAAKPEQGAAPLPTTTPMPSEMKHLPAPTDGFDPQRFGGSNSKDGQPDADRFGGPKTDPAYGAFQRGLYKTAYNLALPRAEAGDAAAQTLIAEILSRGLGVARNDKEAAKWYAKAAEQGVPEAQFQYALILLDGELAPKDRKAAYALMQSAAEAGNQLAQFNYAQMLIEVNPGDKGLEKAAVYYERAAQSGLADAQYAMSQIYANGVGGKNKDDVEARRWLLLAARQGFDTAELDLGTWLVQGRGGPKDEKGGFAWMMQAAAGGNVAAQNRLAKLYMNGLGTDPDLISAAAWYIVARRAGLKDPVMDSFLDGLDSDQLKQALQKANRLR
ncbi:TPR repeat protein [Mesorhizobium soli]|uniref:tetratricopeptide repeat protein n=1 Tax=Pseudaminobacter soli (ex Li et al. 2025) TaxID=1295366 RepID=UPI00247311A5|nr:tetratricopeptide repeat protein [Mesorhizobium soli]MDH6231118.1 TPR repeat protein [Mesorhizobium soli]